MPSPGCRTATAHRWPCAGSFPRKPGGVPATLTTTRCQISVRRPRQCADGNPIALRQSVDNITTMTGQTGPLSVRPADNILTAPPAPIDTCSELGIVARRPRKSGFFYREAHPRPHRDPTTTTTTTTSRPRQRNPDTQQIATPRMRPLDAASNLTATQIIC